MKNNNIVYVTQISLNINSVSLHLYEIFKNLTA